MYSSLIVPARSASVNVPDGAGGPSYREAKGGLLGALPDGGKDSLLFAFGCCPVRFDLDHSLFASQIVMEAAPYPILRTLRQSTLYWITVNITQLLDALLLAPDVEIVIACLPERLRLNIPALRFAIGRATHGRGMQLSADHLLQHLQYEREILTLRFAQ